MTTKPSNIKALETGTGKSWEFWIKFLESIDAQSLSHDEIAKRVNREGANEWWSQGVTVAYEQYIGRRKPGQTCHGDFQITVSKTVKGTMDEVLGKWEKTIQDIIQFDGVKITRAGSSSQTAKWRYWRCGLEDGSTVNVNIQTKQGGEKSSLAINHDKLNSAEDAERWRSYWKSFAVSE